MQENLELNKEEISSETWMWILFLFAQSQEIEEQKQYGPLWDKFEEELISKNRFFSDSPVVQEIENTAEKAIKEYPAGSLFYRARIFRGAPSDKFSDYYVKENGGTKKQFEEQLSGLSSMETQWLGLAPLGVALPDDSSEFLQKILATRKKWLKYVRYKGFNAKDSSAPPADKVNLSAGGLSNGNIPSASQQLKVDNVFQLESRIKIGEAACEVPLPRVHRIVLAPWVEKCLLGQAVLSGAVEYKGILKHAEVGIDGSSVNLHAIRDKVVAHRVGGEEVSRCTEEITAQPVKQRIVSYAGAQCHVIHDDRVVNRRKDRSDGILVSVSKGEKNWHPSIQLVGGVRVIDAAFCSVELALENAVFGKRKRPDGDTDVPARQQRAKLAREEEGVGACHDNFAAGHSLQLTDNPLPALYLLYLVLWAKTFTVVKAFV